MSPTPCKSRKSEKPQIIKPKPEPSKPVTPLKKEAETPLIFLDSELSFTTKTQAFLNVQKALDDAREAVI